MTYLQVSGAEIPPWKLLPLPGTDRHDCDDVDERGVASGTSSRGGCWKPATPDRACSALSHGKLQQLPVEPENSDMMITGDSGGGGGVGVLLLSLPL
jgi:hypothetical protein